jgi:3-deoxy-manno-octulosonate cytidylyltransferase (CMP-KDO synthetase)
VWRRVSTFQTFDQIVIATDSDEVAGICRDFGASVELTSHTHPSGTDRIAELMERPAYAAFGSVVNVQGDEPFVTQTQVEAALGAIRDGFDIGTVATPVRTLEAWKDPSVVKVVRGEDGSALYFSRATIPFLRDGDPSAQVLVTDRFLRHIGVYAYTRSALRAWVALPMGDLESIEKLEQLRPLAAGLTIGVGIVSEAENGVDTLADAVRAAAKLQRDPDSALQPAAAGS